MAPPDHHARGLTRGVKASAVACLHLAGLPKRSTTVDGAAAQRGRSGKGTGRRHFGRSSRDSRWQGRWPTTGNARGHRVGAELRGVKLRERRVGLERAFLEVPPAKRRMRSMAGSGHSFRRLAPSPPLRSAVRCRTRPSRLRASGLRVRTDGGERATSAEAARSSQDREAARASECEGRRPVPRRRISVSGYSDYRPTARRPPVSGRRREQQARGARPRSDLAPDASRRVGRSLCHRLLSPLERRCVDLANVDSSTRPRAADDRCRSSATSAERHT